MFRRRLAWLATLPCLLLFAFPAAAGDGGPAAAKETAVASIDAHRDELVGLSRQIWGFAELALREKRSAALLADYAESQGFAVERGVAGMPTAFTASYGSGEPVVAILGEYDALPGLSQAAVPERSVLEPGAAGHGCGHNLFGPASLGAALAIQELLAAGDLRGTVRFYGTPAEESVGGKLYMARDGLFEGIGAALAWHPDSKTSADTASSQAMVDFVVEFEGKAAHAAYDPWNGRSAVDGLEIFTHAVNLLREHVKPTVRIHYAIADGGEVPNVVPTYARLWCWVRDSKRSGVDDVMTRVRKIAEGAALAADVDSRLTVQTGSYEMLPSFAGARLVHANMKWLGAPGFTAEEEAFARALQASAGVEETGMSGEIEPLDEHPGEPEGGSTDVADVSWIVPTIHLSVATAPAGVPWHAWPVVASAGSSIGERGMIYAAKALAATMVDLYADGTHLVEMRREFEEKTAGHVYQPYIPDGPPPVPED
jgi:aminobenzoyl-glutamate utilization protein B